MSAKSKRSSHSRTTSSKSRPGIQNDGFENPPPVQNTQDEGLPAGTELEEGLPAGQGEYYSAFEGAAAVDVEPADGQDAQESPDAEMELSGRTTPMPIIKKDPDEQEAPKRSCGSCCCRVIGCML